MQRGIHNEHNQPEDVVAVTDLAYARIAPKWWDLKRLPALDRRPPLRAASHGSVGHPR